MAYGFEDLININMLYVSLLCHYVCIILCIIYYMYTTYYYVCGHYSFSHLILNSLFIHLFCFLPLFFTSLFYSFRLLFLVTSFLSLAHCGNKQYSLKPQDP